MGCADIQTHYQPIIALDSGRVSGGEALARWTHPQRGAVPPSDFIPLAETVGLIAPYVLKEACIQARRWTDVDPTATPRTLSVNISPAQLDPQLAASVVHTLDVSGLAAGNLVVEITETSLRPNAADPVSYLTELRALGVRLSIDDFGIGYSSLSRLADFPMDQLKLDRSLVAGMAERRKGGALVGGVIGLAKSLGLAVVAEGVETAEQSAQLARMGCDYAQGFGVGRPSPPDALDHLFAPGARRAVRREVAQLAHGQATPEPGGQLTARSPYGYGLSQLGRSVAQAVRQLIPSRYRLVAKAVIRRLCAVQGRWHDTCGSRVRLR